MTEKHEPGPEEIRVKKLMEEMANGTTLEEMRVKKIMEEQSHGDSLEDKRIKKLIEEQSHADSLEDKRIKKLMAQESAQSKARSRSVDNRPHPLYDDKEPAPNDEKLRADQIEFQEGKGLDSVSAISAISSVRPVQGLDPVHFADALEQWRYMSEQYRNKRLAKDKLKDPDEQSNTLNNQNNGEQESFAEVLNKYQDSYETDVVDINAPEIKPEKKFEQIYPNNNLAINKLISEEKNNLLEGNHANSNSKIENSDNPKINKEDKKYNFRESMIQSLIQKLSSANLDVDPKLVEEHEHHDIETDGNIMKVVDVMTKNVVSVIDSMTVEQVASIFNKRKITGVPVIHYKSKMPIGIITMSDIIAHIFDEGLVSTFPIEGNNNYHQESFALLDKTVGELMHSEVIEVGLDTTIKEACKLMLDNDIHRVLVTQNNRVRGIFTSFDAVRILAKFDLKLE